MHKRRTTSVIFATGISRMLMFTTQNSKTAAVG
jgi:hypothetical protein